MQHRLAACLIALVLSLCSLIVFFDSSAFEHYKSDIKRNTDYCYGGQHAEENQGTEECQSFLYKAADDPVAAFTGGLFAFTFALSVATVRLFQVTKAGISEQANLTRESLEHASRSARAAEVAIEVANISNERRLRAYVYVKEVSLIESEDNQIWSACLFIKNFGQTPAYDFVSPRGFLTCPKAERYTFNPIPADTAVSPVDLAPGQEMRLFAQSVKPITAEEAKRFRSGEDVIFIDGRASYRDVFGNDRWTNFRMQYRPPSSFDATPDGNDSN